MALCSIECPQALISPPRTAMPQERFSPGQARFDGEQLSGEVSGSFEMPRYFFDVIDGHRLPDPAGLECRDDEEATAHARTIAHQIAADAPGSSRRHIVA